MSDPPSSPAPTASPSREPVPPPPSPQQPRPQFGSVEALEDQSLLARWAEQGDSAAIRELIQRHTGLVMGTAARALSGHQILAEEAAQAVFTIMTAKAATLRHHPTLGLWLHRAALLEASSLRRRETRRRQNLARLAEELDTMYSPEIPSPQWQDALPELDEALERLPAPDRQLLILRYFEGRAYRDIAARLGKTDDSVQKQTSRAVEKLSRLLRRRGVIIPVTVLTSGLVGITAITPKASAALTGKLAAAAITQAPHHTLTASLLHTLKLMACTHTTKLAGGTAAILLLLCGAAGYRSGTASAAAESAASSSGRSNATLSMDAANAHRPAPGTVASPSGNRPRSAAGQASRPPLPEILKAAASIEMGITGNWSRYSENAYPALGHYDIADTEAAIALLPGFRKTGTQFESVAGLIFSVLAEKDWRQAKDRLLQADTLRSDGKLPAQAIRTVADTWGQEDPAAAFLWANGLVEAGRTPFQTERGVGETLLADWLKRDPAAALADMDQRAATQPVLIAEAARISLRQQPRWWLDRLSSDAPPEDRARMLRYARSAMMMVSENGWQDLLETITNDPALAASLVQQIKP